MNITYLIGNGFDLNLRLKTKYSHFYTHFLEENQKNIGTINLKKAIEKDVEDWSDFEKRFGKFTEEFEENSKGITEFNKTYIDVVNSLSSYLKGIEESLDFNLIDKDKFINDIINIESFLQDRDKRNINRFKSKFNANPITINFITFNYTEIIEKIIGDRTSNLPIGKTRNGKNINISTINHIHGYLNKRMIIGVNDETQIFNDFFKNDNRIKYNLIKTISNRISKELIEESCINKINQAQIICLFGLSYGKTDLKWWELIVNQLNRDCRLIIFHHEPQNIHPLIPSERTLVEENVKNQFYSLSKISEDKIKSFDEKIIVSVNNNNFFKLSIDANV